MYTTKEHYEYLSVLKVLGMFSVIIIHCCCTPVTYFYEYYTKTELFFSYFITNLFRVWAVPIFVMISGALFLDPQKNVSMYSMFHKYIRRLLLVLLSFGYFFCLLRILFESRTVNLFLLLKGVYYLLQGKGFSHLWYLYMTIGLYLLTPFIKSMINNLQNKDLFLLLIILFFFNSLLPFLNQLFGFDFAINFPLNGIYVFYYILGYSIHSEKIKISNKICFISLLSLVWLIIAQFITNYTFTDAATIKFTDYNSFLAVLIGTSVFCLAKNNIKEEAKLIEKLTPLSLGVYVIHAFFVQIFIRMTSFTPKNYSVFSCISIYVCFVTLLSILSVYLLRKNKFIKNYIL